MAIESINPATGALIARYEPMNEGEIEAVLARAARASTRWRATSFSERGERLRALAAALRSTTAEHARRISLEMGKPVREARAEIEKCVWGCEYYAEHAEAFLRDEAIATDASRSGVSYAPLGTLLAVMPWNFPYWQVFRAAAPALMAGNSVLLKHASNVPQCAEAIEALFRVAGYPEGVFQALRIGAERAEALIADARVHAVTLTGSETAGRRIAAAAGQYLKKSVLELGGTDAFLVLADADLAQAATVAVSARFQNNGQSCIAAKRFVLAESIADEFLARFAGTARALKVGDPLADDTQIGPLARADLRDTLHRQVRESIAHGAELVFGGESLPGHGYFYAPTLLDRVRPGMPAWTDELFGPVAVAIRVRDEDEALAVANDSRYGLGASIWTRDAGHGEQLARRIESGMGFVNGMVKSDPRLPFGGIKCSGYGRELGVQGIREFVNVRTLWVK